MEFIRCDVKAVQLLQQGEGPLWDEVQHVVVQAERVEAGHFLQETTGKVQDESLNAARCRRTPAPTVSPTSLSSTRLRLAVLQ